MKTTKTLIITSLAVLAIFAIPAVFAVFDLMAAPPAAQRRAQPPRSARLYVFNCGILDVADPGRYQLKKEEVSTDKFSVACFLVAHPRGTLMWDTGAVTDTAWKPTGTPVRQHLVLPDGQERYVTIAKQLMPQLAEVGYQPGDVTHLAVSHYHYDHTANANAFAGATWLVRQVERDAMFGGKQSGATLPASYSALRNSKTVIIKTDDYDVFGDGTVVIKSAPGHTQGHQVLFVKLAQTGPVVLSGDLYHYPEERTLNRLPTFEFNQAQTAASRKALEEFLKTSGAQLWIQHDFLANAKLKKAPAYFE